MSTEVIGYLARPQRALQNIPQTNENAPQQTRTVNKGKLYYIKQKLVGVILIGLGITSAAVSQDGTFLVFMLIMSIPLFGKDKVMMIEEDDEI